MNSMTRCFAILASIALSSMLSPSASADDPSATVDWQSVEQRVLPTAEELRFKEIGWRTVFWDAVKEAQRTDRPILLWAMNGHPLGCT